MVGCWFVGLLSNEFPSGFVEAFPANAFEVSQADLQRVIVREYSREAMAVDVFL